MLLAILFAAQTAFAAPWPVHGVLTGPARVVDGDTIRIDGQSVRLNGVDAPERGLATGNAATAEMRRIVRALPLRCLLNGDRSHGRGVGICLLPDGTDIGAEIIRRGRALDCAHFSGGRYRSLEQPAARRAIRPAPYCR